jgi:hypothetical protein
MIQYTDYTTGATQTFDESIMRDVKNINVTYDDGRMLIYINGVCVWENTETSTDFRLFMDSDQSPG